MSQRLKSLAPRMRRDQRTTIWFCLVFLWLGAITARADVAFLMEEPYGGFGSVNPTGHGALYFNHICAASPTKLRPCHPGELGVVVSRTIGTKSLGKSNERLELIAALMGLAIVASSSV